LVEKMRQRPGEVPAFETIVALLRHDLAQLLAPSLRPVINASGVLLQTSALTVWRRYLRGGLKQMECFSVRTTGGSSVRMANAREFRSLVKVSQRHHRQ
jgi:hypothetical protein